MPDPVTCHMQAWSRGRSVHLLSLPSEGQPMKTQTGPVPVLGDGDLWLDMCPRACAGDQRIHASEDPRQ